MRYCELAYREVEYLNVTRDTSEADLKQRKEIHQKNTQMNDEVAVRAAIYGRVLILDGIQNAERNILVITSSVV